MGRRKYKRVKKKTSYDYVPDTNGKWVKINNKFILESKIPEDETLKKELNDLLKNEPFIKKRVKHIKDIKKKIYYVKVWILTEQNDLTKLKNHDKRGFKKYHLDHIFPISEAYKNGIAPEVVADITNLRFVTRRTNLKKSNSITQKSIDVMKKLLK